MILVTILLQQINDEFSFGFAIKVPIENLHTKGLTKGKKKLRLEECANKKKI